MSRRERLERWAVVLERAASTSLTPLLDVEFVAPRERAALRSDGSPLAIALDDPVLRREGLGSDRFGDGGEFFGLSLRQAHRVLCSCGYVGTMRATEVARRIRAIVLRDRLREAITTNPLPALARWFAGWLTPARAPG
jgi:hypothetical protein